MEGVGLDEWFAACDALVALLRRKLDGQKVTRGEARKVVDEYERTRQAASVEALATLR